MRQCCPARPRRRPRRGPRRPEDRRTDRRRHPPGRHLRVRLGPVALPRHREGRRAAPDGPRVRRHRRGGRQRRHATSSPASSSSARSSPPTTPARSAGPATRPPASTGELIGARPARRPSTPRVPLADGTLVATPELPPDDLIPSLLAASDVLGTGWFAAVAAEAGPGKTVAVVGDGAVGLLGVLAAKQLGAERIIAMSRHEPRQKLAREFGATDIVDRARRRGRRPDQGPHRRARRALGHRGGRHPGVDDAGHPLHPPRRPRRLRRRRPRRRSCPARSCSSPTSTCTAAPPRCAASCPS